MYVCKDCVNMALLIQLVGKHIDISYRRKTYRRLFNVEYIPENQLRAQAQSFIHL